MAQLSCNLSHVKFDPYDINIEVCKCNILGEKSFKLMIFDKKDYYVIASINLSSGELRQFARDIQFVEEDL